MLSQKDATELIGFVSGFSSVVLNTDTLHHPITSTILGTIAGSVCAEVATMAHYLMPERLKAVVPILITSSILYTNSQKLLHYLKMSQDEEYKKDFLEKQQQLLTRKLKDQAAAYFYLDLGSFGQISIR